MTTSPMSLKSVICREDTPLTPAQIGYMTARAQSEAHEVVLSLFLRLAKDNGMTKAFIARRLNKKPEQITRWLGSPGNLTVATVAQLMSAMGHAPKFGAVDLKLLGRSNSNHFMSGAKYNLPPVKSIEQQKAKKEEVGAGISQNSVRQIRFENAFQYDVIQKLDQQKFMGAL